MREEEIRAIVRQILNANPAGPPALPSVDNPAEACMQEPVKVEASARHVHLSKEACLALFGTDVLDMARMLSQPGEFLSGKRLKLVTAKGELQNVAVLGPLREAVQVELSMTDCRALGISAPINLSGDLKGAADVLLVGEHGVYEARGSAIVARAHLHMNTKDAERLRLHDGQRVRMRVQGARSVVLEEIAVRVSDAFALALHIDHDEANACGIFGGAQAELLGFTEAPREVPCPERIPEKAALVADRLITEERAKQLKQSGGTLRLQKGTLLTPSAKDVLAGVRLVFE